MSRETCYRCFWPKSLCWCGSIIPMPTRTRFVFLMHPKEFKQEKAATGRLTHLCLPNSQLYVGVSFDSHPAVQALLASPRLFPVLLYPGENARNLSTGGLSAAELDGRELVVLLLDGTWSCARKMLKLSRTLQLLPRIMFTPQGRSRYVIKQQPQDGCLSTLEATHEVLAALHAAGLDEYPLPAQLLGLFDKMQEHQIRCASDPSRPGYRRRAYSKPGERIAPRGASGVRRSRYLRAPGTTTDAPRARPPTSC